MARYRSARRSRSYGSVRRSRSGNSRRSGVRRTGTRSRRASGGSRHTVRIVVEQPQSQGALAGTPLGQRLVANRSIQMGVDSKTSTSKKGHF